MNATRRWTKTALSTQGITMRKSSRFTRTSTCHHLTLATFTLKSASASRRQIPFDRTSKWSQRRIKLKIVNGCRRTDSASASHVLRLTYITSEWIARSQEYTKSIASCNKLWRAARRFKSVKSCWVTKKTFLKMILRSKLHHLRKFERSKLRLR